MRRYLLPFLALVVTALLSFPPWRTFGAAPDAPANDAIPIPKEVIALIRDEKTITQKKVIHHEWRDGNIRIVTGIVNGPLDGHGYEFTAEKTPKGWILHSIRPWVS